MATDGPVLDRAWRLAPKVAIRPERFGALLYHFGTRRLSFIKDLRLVGVIEGLETSTTAREACDRAGVELHALPLYERALARLAETEMLQERTG